MNPDNVSSKKPGLRIIRLKGSNLRCLKAFDIKPPAGIVVLAGKNGEGKTTVTDAIKMAIEGGSQDHKKAIRRGAKKAEISVEIGDTQPAFTVTKIITGGREAVEVRPAGGEPIGSPQAFLDEFPSPLTFDPCELDKMKGSKRIATLMDLANLREPLEEIDKQRVQLYNERTEISRPLRDAQGELRGMAEPTENAPTELVEVGSLVEKKNQQQAILNDNSAQRRTLQEYQNDVDGCKAAFESARVALTNVQHDLEGANAQLAGQATLCRKLIDPDISRIDGELVQAQRTNDAVTSGRAFQNASAKVAALNEEATAKTTAIDALDEQKAELLAAAEFPVPNLSFDGEDLLLNGIEWSELSHAQRIRISIAIGVALNPQLRILRVEDASLLDEDNWKIVCEEAQKHHCQIWLECVGDRDDATIRIEDGNVIQKEEAANV